MRGNVNVFMVLIGAIALVVTVLLLRVLPDIGIWKFIISVSAGTMIIGIGGYIDIKYNS